LVFGIHSSDLSPLVLTIRSTEDLEVIVFDYIRTNHEEQLEDSLAFLLGHDETTQNWDYKATTDRHSPKLHQRVSIQAPVRVFWRRPEHPKIHKGRQRSKSTPVHA